MGILDIFRSKEQHVTTNKRIHAMHGHVSEAFSSMHNQLAALQTSITQQKEWLKFLHQNHLNLNAQQSDHKEVTKAEVTKINSWVTYLHNSQQKQEKQMAALQKSIEQSTGVYEKHISRIYEEVQKVQKKAAEKPQPQVQVVQKDVDYEKIIQEVMQNLNIDMQAMQTSVKQEVHDSLSESLALQLQEQHETQYAALQELVSQVKEQHVQEEALDAPQQAVQSQAMQSQQVMSQQSQMQQFPQQIYSQEQMHWASQMTNPEQKLLNLLMNEADPLTYTKVSQLTGHSINTIRVNMNSLKKKGVVEESTLPSGVKLFSVTNKEKVKKMYNVSVM